MARESALGANTASEGDGAGTTGVRTAPLHSRVQKVCMKRPAEKTEPAPNSRAGIPSVLLRASTRLLGGCSILWLTRHLPGAVPEEARFLVNQALQLLQDHQVLICSPRLNEGLPRPAFPHPVRRPGSALWRRQQTDPKAQSPGAIFGHGGVSSPIVAPH